MAFFDKLGSAARNLGDKAGSAVETAKLGTKIKDEEKAIAECQRKIGEFIYGLHGAGENLPEEAAALCAQIDGHNAAIFETRAEIERIKAEAAAPVAAPPAAAPVYAPQPYAQPQYAPQPIPQPVAQEIPQPAADQVFCPACGAGFPAGMAFCSACGTKIA
ncbi:MAG: hypothetical protein FWE98_07940 [Oscillospiraceae bacterium]|nr:hypothetical protein [Oscillospiraceae bacterium]